MKNVDLSMIIVSCDAYQDIVTGYLKFKQINWPDCPFDTYVAMEESQFEFPNATIVSCGAHTTWTQRAIKVIEMTQTPYIFLGVDDLYMSEKVDSNDFLNIIDFIKANSVKYYRIPTTYHKNNDIHPKDKNVRLIKKNTPYNVAIGSEIWEREELLRILGDGTMSAWDLENMFLEKSSKQEKGILDGYVADSRRLLHSVHMAKGGKWLPESIRIMKGKGYDIDIEPRGLWETKYKFRDTIYGFGSMICPVSWRAPIKTFLMKIGFKFATKN